MCDACEERSLIGEFVMFVNSVGTSKGASQSLFGSVSAESIS